MSKVGILGGGQLGRMLAHAGVGLNIATRVWEKHESCPAGLTSEVIAGAFESQDLIDPFIKGCDALTLEFENIPLVTLQQLEQIMPLFPPSKAVACAQDRLKEKQLFSRLGIPVGPYAAIDAKQDLHAAADKVGFPAVLKTRHSGYDGKGQRVIKQASELNQAFEDLSPMPLILEAFIPFERELSVIAVRSQSGETQFYNAVENLHKQGILIESRPLKTRSTQEQSTLEEYASLILNELNYVGCLVIEFMQKDGKLFANEMAPRVHNSGHWTIEGAVCSQFENHLRAILDLPLGSTQCRGPVVMFNLISEMPEKTELLKIPNARLHDYGKEPRPGRKLGHVTLLAEDVELLGKEESKLKSLIFKEKPE